MKKSKISMIMLALVLVLAACGNKEIAAPEVVAQKEVSVKDNTSSENQAKADLPEGLRTELAEKINDLPPEIQERILSEIPENLTDDYQDQLAQKLEMFEQGAGGQVSRQKPEGVKGNRQGDNHHAFDSSDAYVNGTRITLDGSKTYTDGTYTGTSTGYQAGMVVTITIKDGLLSDVSITEHNETPGFYEGAFEAVPTTILENQSTDVDTVSGATASSEGIILGVEAALKQAEAK